MARILIIDDEENVRYVLRRILDTAGHEVLEAADGGQGIEISKSEELDLVITDIFMPEVEGLETLREIRKIHPDQKIMVISGGGKSGYLDVLDAAVLLGATEQIAKPFSPSELLAKVDHCLAPG
ncbi:MAG: response regulator [Rhodospirillales bacterium]|jgi:CheY-like chemotaxis protein|nr:response regulator [Rhodospirillales bacterium]|tara:strand:- start:260 stop:631 length:372 start_codon:yes stop_codon:yes gene_type:complete